MKLDKIECFVVKNQPPRHGGRYFIYLRLTTDDGITGVGEIYHASFHPQVITMMAQDVFARQFYNQDPHHIERLWLQSYGAGYTLRPDLSVIAILSGLEMACWDIIGKAAGQPVHQLIGGQVHQRLRSYTYLYPPKGDVYPDPEQPNVYNDPLLAAEAALLAVEQGFSAIKFDPAGPYTIYDGHQPRLEDLERSEAFCREIRKAVGRRADLLFGTHGQFTVSGAKRLARRLEAYDPLWFEEPTTPENPADMAEIARYTAIPIATGERLCSKHEFARVIEAGAASILQMNLGRVGGILEAKKIAAMAACRQIQIAPHLYCGPIVLAANVQLASATPNFLILESIGRLEPYYMASVKTSLCWQEGHVIVPSEAGLGIELNDAYIQENLYTENELHLNMQNHPL